MTALVIEAPSDAQLEMIRRLCAERGWQHPDAVASKKEASEIIGSMLNATYDPEPYSYPFGWEQDLPFA